MLSIGEQYLYTSVNTLFKIQLMTLCPVVNNQEKCDKSDKCLRFR